MKIMSNDTLKPKKQLVVYATFLLLLSGIIGVAFATILPIDQVYILMPLVATVAIFWIFTIILKWRVGDNLFGELGFLYLALAVAYTVIPAFTFMFVNLNLASGWVWEKLAQLLPSPIELGIHLWRHVLFIFGIAVGYLLARGRGVPRLGSVEDPEGKDGPTIVLLLAIATICILALTLMSAPVETYIDNYTRYDHLSWAPRKIISLCLRMKYGIYSVLMVFLFRKYKKYKFIIPIIVAILCLYEMTYSFGSRIESLTVLLEALCLYHYIVKPVNLKKGLIACLAIGVLFSAVEIFRSSEFNVGATRDIVSQQGFMPASEFGAVYFPGYHLYEERAGGTMPPTEWPMFFNDFISLVTFSDFNRWNPQYWYARAYYPDAVVPPETLGPIADSAIWGGEIDLLIRSLINGIFFAYLVRWFQYREGKWWSVVIYIYCYATCVMALKYSIFYHLTPLLKTVLPTLLLVGLFRKLIPSKRRSEVTDPV